MSPVKQPKVKDSKLEKKHNFRTAGQINDSDEILVKNSFTQTEHTLNILVP